MRKKVVNKLMVNWAASFLSVVILLSMVAAPALAMMAASSVDSSLIADGSILTRDIKRDAITSSRIKDYSITKEDIHSGSINKYKLTSNAVNTYKIEDGSVKTQDIADEAIDSAKLANGQVKNTDLSDNAVDSAKIADGTVGSADVADGSITDADISGGAAISDSKISYDTTKTGYLSIPPAAIQPIYQGYDYTNQGGSLYLYSGGPSYFTAPVNLPDGAIVQKLTFWKYDNHAEDMQVLLYRVNDTGGFNTMAQVSSSGSQASWSSLSDGSISYSTVDNSASSYIIQMVIFGASTDLKAGNIKITYEYFSPGS